MNLKDITSTIASCIITVFGVVSLIKFGEVYDSASKTISETRKTIDVVNNNRDDIGSALNLVGRVCDDPPAIVKPFMPKSKK